MSYIKHQRDRREYDLKRALEACAVWRPRLMLGLNREAIDEELKIGADRIWTIPEPMTIQPIPTLIAKTTRRGFKWGTSR